VVRRWVASGGGEVEEAGRSVKVASLLGVACTGSVRVDSANQIEGSVKPRGVRPTIGFPDFSPHGHRHH